MLYSLKKLIVLFGNNNFSLILRFVLDRRPIVIIGRNRENIDDLANSLMSLAPHRTQLVFYSDFVEMEEYENLIQEELDNFTVPRIMVCSHTDSSQFALDNNFKLDGWIVAFKTSNKKIENQLISKIQEKEASFLVIIFNDEDQVRIETYGTNLKSLNLGFEKKLLKRAIEKSQISLEKMKRVLEKKVKIPSSSDIMKTVINFNIEEDKIQMNIFNEEIQAFAHASVRALAILSRIDLLHELGIDIKISDKTFLRTIDFEIVNSARIIEFLKSEYRVDFSRYLQNGWKSALGDKIDSLWG